MIHATYSCTCVDARAAFTCPHPWLDADAIASMGRCSDHRLTQVLVRMGGCRFVAGAQDVDVIVQALVAAGDYVRDFSLPAVQS